jgi:uncharacterized protein YgiM (DUF1202 family)
MFTVAQTSLANDSLFTIDDVNFRTGPSRETSVITTLAPGTEVLVVEHAWSKVRYNGTVGYIRSDFLVPSSAAHENIFLTTDGVNFRNGSSLDSGVITTLNSGTSVEMLEPGWAKVTFNGTTGYCRSDFLVASLSAGTFGGHTTLKTNDGVNLRSGPSTNNSIVMTLNANTSVQVIEHDPNGWSRVQYNGTTGYIKSEFLSVSGRYVELLDWSVVRNLIQYRTSIRVVDVRTGISYNIQCFAKGDHADVQTITKADTAAHLRTHDGVYSWRVRPVWVTIGDRTIAASLHGMPHDVSWISDNDMNGHLCLHFKGSTTSSTSASYRASLQNAVQEAWESK